jgi:hypothetical protein
MNPDYCSCNEFEKAIFYDDIQCFGPEGNRYNAIKKQGWYIFDMGYQRLIASLESFKYCPWTEKNTFGVPSRHICLNRKGT